LGSIQAQLVDVELSRLSKSHKVAIGEFCYLLGHIHSERVQDPPLRGWFPEIPFEFVAGMTAVDPVFRLMQSASGPRPKMIDRKLRSDILFADATVTATMAKTIAERFSFVLSHWLLVDFLSLRENGGQLAINRKPLFLGSG
jgi:hypothetical protein